MSSVSSFIASKLRFKGRLAGISITISFLVMILAVSISAGFRKEIRSGVSAIFGDVQLTPSGMSLISDDRPASAKPAYLSVIDSLPSVSSVTPAVYRAGIVHSGENIQGVLFKGIPDYPDTCALGISIPSRLAEILGLRRGDKMLTYFVSDNVKVRNFTICDIYPSILESNESQVVYLSIADMQRLNGWDEDEVSALEVCLSDDWKSPSQIEEACSEIGTIAMLMGDEDDCGVAVSVVQRFPQLFDWLNLIDFNVLFILILMTIVAGFNMISGLLILLFRSISTIGVLKSMGMTDRNISAVFLKVSSQLVLKGMLVGNALAAVFCFVQSRWHLIELDPANYFVPYVPVDLNLPMVLAADVAAYICIMVLLLIPCLFISRVDPAKTVRVR